ncbi:MAG: hypothetical protein WAU07_03370, partial [Microgenomates group bacterium]
DDNRIRIEATRVLKEWVDPMNAQIQKARTHFFDSATLTPENSADASSENQFDTENQTMRDAEAAIEKLNNEIYGWTEKKQYDVGLAIFFENAAILTNIEKNSTFPVLRTRAKEFQKTLNRVLGKLGVVAYKFTQSAENQVVSNPGSPQEQTEVAPETTASSENEISPEPDPVPDAEAQVDGAIQDSDDSFDIDFLTGETDGANATEASANEAQAGSWLKMLEMDDAPTATAQEASAPILAENSEEPEPVPEQTVVSSAETLESSEKRGSYPVWLREALEKAEAEIAGNPRTFLIKFSDREYQSNLNNLDLENLTRKLKSTLNSMGPGSQYPENVLTVHKLVGHQFLAFVTKTMQEIADTEVIAKKAALQDQFSEIFQKVDTSALRLPINHVDLLDAWNNHIQQHGVTNYDWEGLDASRTGSGGRPASDTVETARQPGPVVEEDVETDAVAEEPEGPPPILIEKVYRYLASKWPGITGWFKERAKNLSEGSKSAKKINEDAKDLENTIKKMSTTDYRNFDSEFIQQVKLELANLQQRIRQHEADYGKLPGQSYYALKMKSLGDQLNEVEKDYKKYIKNK